MAYPTAVNSQITDSITQTNVKVLGEASAQAMGSLYQAMAATVGLSMQNAVAAQQASQTIAQAVTTRCVQLLVGANPIPS